jgi:glutathione-regulated potassium-efflux system ancillary protein KefG
MPPSILLLFVHPAYQNSRANRTLLDAVRPLEGLTVHDLYEEYPDFDIDVSREQQLLTQHDLIVFQHPFYWYSCPALLKEWLDLVLQYDFAYGPQGTALAGKRLLSAITTGGSRSAYQSQGYNRFTIRQFLAPFEQTANLYGMQYLPPFVAHGMHSRPAEAELAAHADMYRRGLEALSRDELDRDILAESYYLNDALGADPALTDPALTDAPDSAQTGTTAKQERPDA